MFRLVKSYGSMECTLGIWKTWEVLRRHLLLSPLGNLLPAHWQIADIINALHPFSALSHEHTISLNAMLGKLGVTKAEHLWDPTSNTWKDFDEKMTRLCGIPQWLRDLTIEFMELIAQVDNITWNP